MKKVWNFVKQKTSQYKQVVTAALVGGAVSASTLVTHAAGTADTATVTSITGAFDDVKATALAALAAIAVIAIALFAGIYAWKYGKKIFSVISK